MDTMQSTVAALNDALPYVAELVGKTVLVKLGGSALGSHDTAIQDLVALHKLGVRPVVVHGGGAAITSWLGKLGTEARFVNGLRVTDDAAMDVVTMVLGGLVNKELVAQLMQAGGRALGFSGVDGGLLRARIKEPALGRVGEVTAVDPGPIRLASEAGFIPVVAPLGLGDDGRPLNLNADTAAGEIAAALGAAKLLFLTDVPGIADRDGTLLGELSVADALGLIDTGIVTKGMIPKIQACVRALDGVARAHIIDGRAPHALLCELFTSTGVGTVIQGRAT
ncbi:MAG: acetylglutamate kinase [Chloroflexi bacterium]|nr:acetylglutamate kinase [Chloroflexota bacterium]